MIGGLEAFIDKSNSLGSVSELLDLYLETIAAEGYQNAVFARARDRRLVSVAWHRLPPNYVTHYNALEWDKIDPVVQRIHSTRRPFRWSDISTNAELARRQKIFLDECRELGVHSGITMPLHGPGTEVDLISLSLRDQKGPDVDRTGILYAASAQYRMRYGQLTDKPMTDAPRLTVKELECLRWCKEGKTNWEIGEIMSTSERTVEFHLSNAIRKLGASNRITAVVVGIRFGLISL